MMTEESLVDGWLRITVMISRKELVHYSIGYKLRSRWLMLGQCGSVCENPTVGLVCAESKWYLFQPNYSGWWF